MSRVLVIESSARQRGSVSRLLTAAQFGIPTGDKNVQAFFRASGLWQPVCQKTKCRARDYSAKIP